MTIVPFGDWTPDAAALRNPGALRVSNAFPGLTGYKPVPSFVQVTGATTSRPLGARAAKDSAGNIFQYAGDAGKLYELVGTTWTDRSKAGGYAAGVGERWVLVRWKNKMLATDFTDAIQQITFGGANFADLTTDFRCRELSAVGNFVVAGNTSDATDGDVPWRVRWSGFDDETDWTVSPVTLSDFRDLQAGGAVLGVVGGEFGVVITALSTWRMSFVGAPTVFQFDEVLPGLGALSRGSIVALAGTVYFLSEQGFVALRAGTEAQFIGAGRIDQFVRNDLDEASLDRMYTGVDAQAGRVMWLYAGAGNTEGLPNRILVYDRSLDKWSLIEDEFEILWRGASAGVTLDEADEFPDDIDAAGAPSLDSSIYKGGAPQLAAFDPTFKSGFFAGDPMTAQIDTREAELNPGRRTHLLSFRPVVDGGTVTAQIAARNRQGETANFGPVLTETASGEFKPRSNARFHRARINISGDWDDAIGIDIDRRGAKPGEFRG